MIHSQETVFKRDYGLDFQGSKDYMLLLYFLDLQMCTVYLLGIFMPVAEWMMPRLVENKELIKLGSLTLQ